jgi:two-component system response regulator FixJ
MPPNRKLIAVIDDDASVRKALDRQITAAGYRCHAFVSAEQFLSVAALCGAAAVVCDIHLDGMTGLEFAQHPTVAELYLPVLLISGSGDPDIERSADAVGAAFLRKPISTGKLLEALVDTVGPPIDDGED